MPRFARQKHDNAIYHIMVRGNNREKIFYSLHLFVFLVSNNAYKHKNFIIKMKILNLKYTILISLISLYQIQLF